MLQTTLCMTSSKLDTSIMSLTSRVGGHLYSLARLASQRFDFFLHSRANFGGNEDMAGKLRIGSLSGLVADLMIDVFLYVGIAC